MSAERIQANTKSLFFNHHLKIMGICSPTSFIVNKTKVFPGTGKDTRNFFHKLMKYLLSFCAILLLLCLGSWPIGYYTLVRIVVTIGAVYIVINEPGKDLNFWRVSFGLIAIIFNPIIPIYLHDKTIWIVIDIIAAALFITKLLTLKSTKHE